MNKGFSANRGVVVGTLVVLAAAVLIATQTGMVGAALAQTKVTSEVSPSTTETSLPRTITVVGTGTVTIEPDIANVMLGVETSGTSVKLATDESTETMEAIIAALKAEGVATRDIETSGFSVWSDRRTSEATFSAEEATTYWVNNILGVTVRDLDSLGAVLDAAIEAGANTIQGVTFTLAEPEPQEAEARAAAVANARAKAEELAELTGVSVGQVVSVSEVVGSGSYYASNFALLNSTKMGLGGAGAITPGELELSLELQVVYAIQ